MRRPWNIINVPVYSLATYQDGRVNMNICTYVSGLSMQPKQYMIGVYRDTETHHRLVNNAECILQILHHDQHSLVKTLGKKSGKNLDKHDYLKQKEQLSTWLDLPVLKNACAYLKVKCIKRLDTQGDHELFVLSVEKSKTISENKILMFQDLISKGIIL